MTTNHRESLESLLRESGRQSDFFHRRQRPDISDFWSAVEGLAYQALRERKAIVIGISQESNPLPIKGCEQVKQLPNHQTPKDIQ